MELNSKELLYPAIFLIIGFTLAYFINYKPNMKNKNERQELDLLIGNKCYHIHHWITFTLIIIILFIGKYIITQSLFFSIIGILFGFILEDFLFTGKKSLFKIKNSCKLKNKNYSGII